MSLKDPKNKLAFLSMPAPASYVAGLGRGCVPLFSQVLVIDRKTTVPLDSQHDRILALPEKVPRKKSSRTSSHLRISPNLLTLYLPSFEKRNPQSSQPESSHPLAKLAPNEAKMKLPTPNNSKTPTTNMGCSQG